MRGVFPFIIGLYYSFIYIVTGLYEGTWMPIGNVILGLLFIGWSFVLQESDAK